jgi:hypothetical protein
VALRRAGSDWGPEDQTVAVHTIQEAPDAIERTLDER